MGTSKLSGKPDEMLGVNLRYATETGIRSGSYASQACETFFFLLSLLLVLPFCCGPMVFLRVLWFSSLQPSTEFLLSLETVISHFVEKPLKIEVK